MAGVSSALLPGGEIFDHFMATWYIIHTGLTELKWGPGREGEDQGYTYSPIYTLFSFDYGELK